MKRKAKIMCLLPLCLFMQACKKELAHEVIKNPTAKVEKAITLSLTGDLLFEQGLYDAMDNYQFGSYFDQVKPYLKGDLVIGNLEVPIGGREMGVNGVAFVFNAPEDIAPQLYEVGFNVFTLANNHSYDMGYTGVVNTLNTLQQSNIKTVGMYADPKDYSTTRIIEKNGIKVAILAYTYDTNIPFEQEHDYIVKTFLNENKEFDAAHQLMLKQDIAQAKEKADVVITAMHWGNEFTYNLNEAQLTVSKFLNEQGVDLVIGNHSHCLQTMDILKDDTTGKETVVFYSLGNFVSSAAMVGRASEQFANMYEVGGIVNLTIRVDEVSKETMIEDMELTPVVNHFEHNYTNFALLPFPSYSEDLASSHYQREYSSDFTYNWLKKQIDSLFEGKIKITE